MKKMFPSLLGHNIEVPVVNGQLLNYLNLDNAATTPPFCQVFEKLQEVMPYYGSVHRGCGYKSIISTELYEKAKESILSFADGDSNNDTIIFGVNATDCINHLARRLNLAKDEYVIISENEHTSNVLPWRKMSNVLECHSQEDGAMDLNYLESLLKLHKVRLVAVTGASNVTGEIVDTFSIAALAHEYDAEICVDASQLAGHRKIGRGTIGSKMFIDYIIFSGHKMYAPFGVGVLVGNKKIFMNGWPDMVGGGTVKWMDTQEIIWSDLPERENGGTPNYFGIVALAEACKMLDNIGFENISSHEALINDAAKQYLSQIPSVRFINPFILGQNRLPIFSFFFEGYSHGLVGSYLGYEKAIGVRTGFLCQYNLIKRFLSLNGLDINLLNVGKVPSSQSFNNFGITRVSCGLGNTVKDIFRIAQDLKYLDEVGPSTKYLIDNSGNYRPVNL